MNDNVATVQKIYDAFSRADVDAILGVLTDDVDWAAEASSRQAPWYGARRGKAEVAQFFTDLADAIDVTEFTVLSIGSNQTDVMAVIRFDHRQGDREQRWDGSAPLVAIPRPQGLPVPRDRGHSLDRSAVGHARIRPPAIAPPAITPPAITPDRPAAALVSALSRSCSRPTNPPRRPARCRRPRRRARAAVR